MCVLWYVLIYLAAPLVFTHECPHVRGAMALVREDEGRYLPSLTMQVLVCVCYDAFTPKALRIFVPERGRGLYPWKLLSFLTFAVWLVPSLH